MMLLARLAGSVSGRLATCQSRLLSTTSGSPPGKSVDGTEGEEKVAQILRKRFPDADFVVQDISGGCGAMYQVQIAAEEFRGKPKIKQHRLVTEALKTEIAEMHGINIHTQVPQHGGS